MSKILANTSGDVITTVGISAATKLHPAVGIPLAFGSIVLGNLQREKAQKILDASGHDVVQSSRPYNVFPYNAAVFQNEEFVSEIEEQMPGSSDIIKSLQTLDLVKRKATLISIFAQATQKELSPEQIKLLSTISSEDQLLQRAQQVSKELGVNPELIIYELNYIR